MLILPRAVERTRALLIAVSAAVVVGLLVATLIRLGLHWPIRIPLTWAALMLPMLSVVWLWHLRGWAGCEWVETSAYVLMVAAAQYPMEVDVTAALLVVPVIGVMHRSRRLTVYAAALGTATYGALLWIRPVGLQVHAPALQFGACAVLQGTLVLTYFGLIHLAEQAEERLQHAFMTEHMAMQWAASIEARDRYTGGHVERVTRYAEILAPLIPDLGVELAEFRLASVLHDVGKISVPDGILNKPGRLDPDELRVMQAHAANGYDLVIKTRVPMPVARVVRHHHERWDGTGYPDGLSGERIPKAARVLAVADAFDAMTSSRPYRKALSPDEARQEILACAGTHFDPAVVCVFASIYDRWAALAAEHHG